MTMFDQSKLDQAVEWAMRVDSPAFDDWQELERWLALDATHTILFDAACNQIDEAARGVAGRVTQPRLQVVDAAGNENPAPRRRSLLRGGGWIGTAVAAAMIAIVGYGFVADRSAVANRAELFVSRPGEVRTITLGSRGKATLNGDSMLRVEHGAREVELVFGQAIFDIRHDPTREFTVRVGSARVTDLGTRFDVDRDGGDFTVAVADGLIDVSSGGSTVRVTKGQRSAVVNNGAPRRPTPVPAEAIGGWQSGKLVYSDASISEVARDIGRRTGIRLTPSRAVADRPFAGIIDIRGDVSLLMRRLEDTLDVDAVAFRGGWVLNARADRGREG
jgi:transmembrane sensor